MNNESHNYPLSNHLRLPQVLEIIPVSKSTWWAGVKSGRFPKPVKLGPNIAMWRIDDIRNLLRQNENKS